MGAGALILENGEMITGMGMGGVSLVDGMARGSLGEAMPRRKGARRAAWACMLSCVCLSLIYKGNAVVSSCLPPKEEKQMVKTNGEVENAKNDMKMGEFAKSKTSGWRLDGASAPRLQGTAYGFSILSKIVRSGRTPCTQPGISLPKGHQEVAPCSTNREKW